MSALRLIVVAAASATLALAQMEAKASGEPPFAGSSIGFEVDASNPAAAGMAMAPAGEPGTPAPAPVIRIGVLWSGVEDAPGSYRFDGVDAAVGAAISAGRAVILNFHGAPPGHLGGGRVLSSADEAVLSAWSEFLRSAAARYAGRVRWFQVGRLPEGPSGDAAAARDYAFVFKRSATAIRSQAPDALIALGTIDASSLEFMTALLAEDVAPYADAVSAGFDGSEHAASDLAKLRGLILANDPSAALWVNGVKLLLGNPGYAGLLRAWVAGLEQEAALVTFDDPPDSEGRPFHLAAMTRAAALFGPGFSPLVESGRGVQALSASGTALPGARTARFFDPDTKTVLMAYDAGSTPRRGEFGVFVLDTVDLADPVLHDLASGERSAMVTLQKDPNGSVSRLALPLAEYPIVLSYRRATTPEYAAEGEKVAVTGERLPTAEEIIARHQAAQDAQDALLRSVSAEADETWHFKVGTGSFDIDITFKEAFYLDPNVGAEWEQKEIYVNGVRWKLKTIPELPFISPEKVASLPLRITLTKDYRYEYDGQETVEGRDCHVLSFRPIDATKNLGSGRVWIDSETFARVRVAMIQSNLPPPVISNDQRDTYAPVPGPDGYTYWVLSRIESQVLHSTTGRIFVINKDVRLRDFVINDPAFETRRSEALGSAHRMLRDTDAGLRYLEKTPDGGRKVKEGVSTTNIFVLGGVLYNESLDFPVPLAGVNYYNPDFLDRGLQTNVFFAGVLLFANLSDPALFGTKIDGSIDLTGLGIGFGDRLVREDPASGNLSEREKEEVTRKRESLTLGMGFPFAKFFKLRAEADLAYDIFARSDEKCGAFVTPEDTAIGTGSLIGEFNRKAWAVTASHSWSRRSDHEPWGLDASTSASCPPPANAALHPDFFEGAKEYVRYTGTLAKDFYLPFNQKIQASVTGFGGRDLDRFSKFGFNLFDNRLRGFGGSGVRFTNGGVAKLNYAFTLGDVVRFDASIERASVKDRQQGEDFRNHTGVGLSGQFVGPWGLVIRAEAGMAAASDIPEFRGEKEFQITILKLFSQR